MKRTIKLTESELHTLISESVKKVINEIGDTERGQYALGAVTARNQERFGNAMRRGDRQQADKYQKTWELANQTSFKNTNNANDAQGSAEYYNKKDLYNANQRGLRNYNSSISGAGGTNYKTAPQTKQEVEDGRRKN